MKTFKIVSLVLYLTASLIISPSLNAREWKPAAIDAARDYLKIEHKLENGQIIVLFWIAPQYLEPRSASHTVRLALLDHIMIAVMHFSFDAAEQVVPQPHSEFAVEARSLGAVQKVGVNDLPTELTSFADSFRKIVTGGDPTLGQAVNIQFYDGSKINYCGQDVLYVNYLEEKYDFKTPLPGCE